MPDSDDVKEVAKVGGPAAVGAVAGAVVLGPVGAVVGGLVGLITGIVIKKKTE